MMNGLVPGALATFRDKGIRVVSKAGGTHATWEEELRAAAEREPDHVIDDGAELTMRVGVPSALSMPPCPAVTSLTARLRDLGARVSLIKTCGQHACQPPYVLGTVDE